MSAEDLATKYIRSAEKVLAEIQRTHGTLTVNEKQVNNIIEHVEAYVKDAKYYKAQKRFETSLTSIAYCEGLLDALKLLGAVKFEWPTNKENKKPS
jgi:FAD synthetase